MKEQQDEAENTSTDVENKKNETNKNSDSKTSFIENKERLPENAENAVPPEAWKNQKKAYDDAWENNKNQQLEDDM